MAVFDKHSLLNLMSDPSEISYQDLEELNEIIEEYPFFQLGHALVAKAKHDKQTPDAHQALTHAAVYVPNRKLLRSLFYEDLKIDYTPASEAEVSTTDDTLGYDEISKTDFIDDQEDHSADETTLQTPENHDAKIDFQDTEDDTEQVTESDEVYNELEENLRKLRESKNQFSSDEEAEGKKKIVNETVHPQPTDSHASERNKHSVAPFLMELVDDSNEVNQPVKYGNPEQNELIDRFINSSQGERFQITKSDHQDGDHDLSLESVNANEDLITENLAEIYLRQGRKEKAIEIYHKLIWKFPHKKAYFAELIEKLKAD